MKVSRYVSVEYRYRYRYHKKVNDMHPYTEVNNTFFWINLIWHICTAISSNLLVDIYTAETDLQ